MGIFLSSEIPAEVERFVAGEQTPFVPETVSDYSQFLALQLKARAVGIDTPVYGLQEVHHLS